MNDHIRVRAGGVIIEDDSILLIEFHDESGLHYNLPAGGTEPGESVKEAVRREANEEANIDVEVGSLAFVYEYAPHLNSHRYGDRHSLGLMFECKIKEGHTARLPERPDKNQTDVKWIPLSELENITLYPNIKKQIIQFAQTRNTIDLIEEHTLLLNI